jgi:hypothetical protein
MCSSERSAEPSIITASTCDPDRVGTVVSRSCPLPRTGSRLEPTPWRRSSRQRQMRVGGDVVLVITSERGSHEHHPSPIPLDLDRTGADSFVDKRVAVELAGIPDPDVVSLPVTRRNGSVPAVLGAAIVVVSLLFAGCGSDGTVRTETSSSAITELQSQTGTLPGGGSPSASREGRVRHGAPRCRR